MSRGAQGHLVGDGVVTRGPGSYEWAGVVTWGPWSSQGEASGSESRWEQGCCAAGREEGGGTSQEPTVRQPLGAARGQRPFSPGAQEAACPALASVQGGLPSWLGITSPCRHNQSLPSEATKDHAHCMCVCVWGGVSTSAQPTLTACVSVWGGSPRPLSPHSLHVCVCVWGGVSTSAQPTLTACVSVCVCVCVWGGLHIRSAHAHRMCVCVWGLHVHSERGWAWSLRLPGPQGTFRRASRGMARVPWPSPPILHSLLLPHPLPQGPRPLACMASALDSGQGPSYWSPALPRRRLWQPPDTPAWTPPGLLVLLRGPARPSGLPWEPRHAPPPAPPGP